MIIKSIEKYKNQYKVTFEDDSKIIVSEDIIVKYHLIKGKEFNNFDVIENEKKIEEIYKKVIRFASFGKSENQIKSYLYNLGIDDIDVIIKRLKREKYINDDALIRSLKNKNYSKHQLKEKLMYYQFDEILIDEIIDSYDETKALNKIYTKLLTQYKKEQGHKKNEKLYRNLISKGFNETLVQSILKIEE